MPYKGSGPSITDLIGRQIQYTFDTPSSTLAHVAAGRLKALAVAARDWLQAEWVAVLSSPELRRPLKTKA